MLRREGWGVTWLAFHPGGRWLACSGVADTEGGPVAEVWLWDVASGKGRLVLGGDPREGLTSDLAFDPAGGRLATAHHDGTVKVWDVTQLLGQAR